VDDEIIYFEHRVEAELELAQHATKAEVVAAHCKMANAYMERIEELRAAAAAGSESDAGFAPIEERPADRE
ncbi:hypothetical protein NL436_27890, partial [Klebsiella pneumoniae]|nr:hypothetical protein [Klebsiella pneumoniae]